MKDTKVLMPFTWKEFHKNLSTRYDEDAFIRTGSIIAGISGFIFGWFSLDSFFIGILISFLGIIIAIIAVKIGVTIADFITTIIYYRILKKYNKNVCPDKNVAKLVLIIGTIYDSFDVMIFSYLSKIPKENLNKIIKYLTTHRVANKYYLYRMTNSDLVVFLDSNILIEIALSSSKPNAINAYQNLENRQLLNCSILTKLTESQSDEVLLAVSKNINTDQDSLISLALKNSEYAISAYENLEKRECLSTDILLKLAYSHSHKVELAVSQLLLAVSQNIDTDQNSLILIALKDKDYAINSYKCLEKKGLLSSDVLLKLAESASYKVLLAVANNINTDQNSLISLALKNSEYAISAYENLEKKVLLSTDVLSKLAKSTSYQVLFAVANNINTDENSLISLAVKNSEYAINAYKNLEKKVLLSTDVLSKLAESASERILNKVAIHYNTSHVFIAKCIDQLTKKTEPVIDKAAQGYETSGLEVFWGGSEWVETSPEESHYEYSNSDIKGAHKLLIKHDLKKQIEVLVELRKINMELASKLSELVKSL